MARNEALFRLIKSLSGAEKRYLVLQARRPEANFMRLFRAIDAQHVYDEPALQALFADETFARQLHVTKNYLYRFILDHLRMFHKGKTPDVQLAEGLGNVALLFSRELYEAATDELNRLEPIARRYEKLYVLLDIQLWKKRLQLYLHGSRQARPRIQAILADERVILDQLLNLHTYRELILELPRLLMQSDDEFNLTKRPTPLTFMARILEAHLSYPLMIKQRKVEEAEVALNLMLGMIEEEPERIRQDPDLYVTALLNKAYFLLRERRRAEVQEVLVRLANVPERYGAPLNTYQRILAAGIELECCRDSLDLSHAKLLMGELKPFLKLHAHKLTPEQQAVFNYQFAYLLFMSGRFGETLPYLNALTQATPFEIRPELQLYARFLNLMTHFELQNITYLRYAVDGVRRYIRKQRAYHPHEGALLRFFSAVSNAPKSGYNDLFTRLRSEVFADTPPEKTTELLDYLNVYAWIDQVTAFRT